MNKKNNRNLRIAQNLHKKIAIIIHHKINDIRIKDVTISKINLSNDLNYAKIFVIFLNEKNNYIKIKKKINILQNTSKFIRNSLSDNLLLRIIPKLIFIYDKSLICGMNISNLINNLIKNNYNS